MSSLTFSFTLACSFILTLTFTCIRDDNATNHTYPRVGDPAEDTWLTVDKRGDDVFSVFVGATDEIYKTYQPTTGTVYYPGGSGTANQPPNGNVKRPKIAEHIEK